MQTSVRMVEQGRFTLGRSRNVAGERMYSTQLGCRNLAAEAPDSSRDSSPECSDLSSDPGGAFVDPLGAHVIVSLAQ